MYLEKIEIFGFKSFADKTVINFSKPVTAIVGPNGCGKSNVVDAFRWVLGGPSAKALRSDKMIDVIFSGTEKRKPLNYAQISLTFTKVDKSLSVDYQEICISRRLYRTGESEWLINRNPVRLKDVHKLLWEAGLGKNAFYIFEQGKIDELILSSPYERRSVFEEAAKIMHFKEKRKEAYRKLNQIEVNLKRVEDIQVEVNKQIETLQKQAEEAEIYKKQKDTLEHLDKQLIIAKWQTNSKKQNELSSLLKEKSQEQTHLKEQITSLEEKIRALKETYHTKSEEAKKAYEAFFEVKKSSELSTFEFKAHKKKLEELAEHTKGLKQALSQFHQKHLQEHKVYLGNQSELSTHQGDLYKMITEHEKSLTQMLELETKVGLESKSRKESQNALMASLNLENELQLKLTSAASQLENIEVQHKSLEKQEESNAAKLAEKNNLLGASNAQHESSLKEFKVAEAQEQKLTDEINEQKAVIEKLKTNLDHLSGEVTSKNAKVSLLQKLKDEFDGYGSATKTLLKYSQDPSSALFDKLSPLTEWIVPQKGYEVCLSALLGPYLQTLVTKSKSDLKQILEFAKEHSLQGFSILCLEHLQQGEPQTDQELAKSNLISDHFLNNVTLGNDLSIDPKPQSLVSKEFFIDSKKVFHHLAQEENNLFLRESELRTIYKELLQLEKEKEELSIQFQKETQKLEVLVSVLLKASNQMRHLSMTIKEAELKSKSLEDDISYLLESSKDFQSKKSALSTSLKTLESKKKDLSTQHLEEKEKRSKLESHFKTIEKAFERNFHSLNEKRSLRSSLDKRIKDVEKEAQSLQENIKIFESKSADFQQQIENMNAQIGQDEESYNSLAAQSQDYVDKEKIFGQKLSIADKHYHSFEDALEALEKKEVDFNQKLSIYRNDLEQNQKSDIEISNKNSQMQAENNLYSVEITDRYSFEKEQILKFSIEESFSITKVEREVRRLRRGLEGYAEVNLKAVADCKEKQERFSFLQCQIEDLANSKEKLVEIITELDNTSRKMFSETFESIRTHFKENYTLLFNGGEADLELNANEDILEAGIEIIAQPPGKKMRSIQQMSGGEKCLTALALLFALFETQSIPFCILDEVDAPLDDTNIERFTRVLKQFVKNHQFIIITHNKRTMAMADILLGISMEEKGVTKVIPLEFDNQPAKEDSSEALV